MKRQKKDFVGQKVRKLRKERAMTQSELAGRIGIIQSDLCRMEKGEYKVSLDVLFRILQVFGMRIGEFFNEPLEDVPGTGGTEAELIDGFRTLGDEARNEVLDYVRFKAQQARREAEADAKAVSAE